MRGTTSESIHTAGVSEDADASEHLCRRGIVLRATVVFCWLPFLSALLLLDSLSQTVLTHTFFASHMSPSIHWSLVSRCESLFDRQRPGDFLQQSDVHRVRSFWISTGVLPTSGTRLRQRFHRKESCLLFSCSRQDRRFRNREHTPMHESNQPCNEIHCRPSDHVTKLPAGPSTM